MINDRRKNFITLVDAKSTFFKSQHSSIKVTISGALSATLYSQAQVDFQNKAQIR